MLNETNYITDEEAVEIFGEEYNTVSDFEKLKAKELEYYSRTHFEFDKSLVNMSTVMYMVGSGKSPKDLNAIDLRLIKMTGKHNFRNKKGVQKINGSIRDNTDMSRFSDKVKILAVVFGIIVVLLLVFLPRWL